MNKYAKALVLLALCGTATAGDLVLKLGTAGNYRYHRIPVTGSVTVNPATGDITVDPVAEAGTSNDGWCPAGSTSGGAPTFTTPLGATPTSLPFGGGTVTLSWAASGATSCTASTSGVSGWNGNAVTSPTNVLLTASGTYNFGITCSNANGSTSGGTVAVTVANNTTPPTACPDRPAPTGITRQTLMTNRYASQQNSEFSNGQTIDISNYSPLFGTSFNQANQVARLFLDTGKYAALQFSTSGVANGATGGISWEQSDGNADFAVMVSPCPGDFDWVGDPNCKVVGNGFGGTINWAVGSGGQSWDCKLATNTTYYINVVASSSSPWTTTTCTSGWCTWLVSVGGFSNRSR